MVCVLTHLEVPTPPSSDRANLRDSVARVLPEWGDDMEAYGRVVGMLAFGHEEMGCLGVAEECARQALRHDAYDPWAGTHPTWLGCRSRRPPCSRFGGCFALRQCMHLLMCTRCVARVRRAWKSLRGCM